MYKYDHTARSGGALWWFFHRLSGLYLAIVLFIHVLNLHVLMSSFYRPEGERCKIVIESTAFPSDRYAVASQIRMRGHDPARELLEWRPRDDQLLYTLMQDDHRSGPTGLFIATGLPPGLANQHLPLVPYRQGDRIWVTAPGWLPLVDPDPARPRSGKPSPTASSR